MENAEKGAEKRDAALLGVHAASHENKNERELRPLLPPGGEINAREISRLAPGEYTGGLGHDSPPRRDLFRSPV